MTKYLFSALNQTETEKEDIKELPPFPIPEYASYFTPVVGFHLGKMVSCYSGDMDENIAILFYFHTLSDNEHSWNVNIVEKAHPTNNAGFYLNPDKFSITCADCYEAVRSEREWRLKEIDYANGDSGMTIRQFFIAMTLANPHAPIYDPESLFEYVDRIIHFLNNES